jgi:hypothetical protein
MAEPSELHDLPPTIGELVLPIVERADPARKESKMNTAVEPVKAGTVTTTAPMTPMDMVYHVVQSGQPIEVVREMMALSREIKQEQAREAFDRAIAGAKSEISPIVRNATGHNSKRYADFSAIARTVDPILSKHGLSYRFKTSQTDKISVTCVVSHEQGHSEETTLSGPADASGSKNAIQAIGSTLTYLQRYSLTAALGLAAANDDDGRAAGKSEDDLRKISPEQVRTILDLLDETESDVEKFCEIGRIDSVPDMLASQYESAVRLLNQKKAKMPQRAAS